MLWFILFCRPIYRSTHFCSFPLWIDLFIISTICSVTLSPSAISERIGSRYGNTTRSYFTQLQVNPLQSGSEVLWPLIMQFPKPLHGPCTTLAPRPFRSPHPPLLLYPTVRNLLPITTGILSILLPAMKFFLAVTSVVALASQVSSAVIPFVEPADPEILPQAWKHGNLASFDEKPSQDIAKVEAIQEDGKPVNKQQSHIFSGKGAGLVAAVEDVEEAARKHNHDAQMSTSAVSQSDGYFKRMLSGFWSRNRER